MRIRTVTLEILRHGPPHNQLLSPLTPYLALSGRYQAVTLHVPWEHMRFQRELGALRYHAGSGGGPNVERVTASDRADIAIQVSRIFDAVPGLIAGLAPPTDTSDVLTHLRLIFSAAELASVPFELSRSPRGFPGEGDNLSTQSVTPLVMTREIRGASGYDHRWPSSPRVLFAWAQPEGQSDVPWRAHLQALVAALRPWTGRAVTELENTTPTRKLKERLTILPRASLADLARACGSGKYTHVHLLAHGGRQPDRDHEAYGMLLHGGLGEPDVDRVSAERLAVALTGQLVPSDGGGQRFVRPAVVTLATCDSGNQGDVVVPGASLAHTLHTSGIPLVVGSLFPLSKRGSVVMTETLYRSLLAGEDPRVALHRTRSTLRTEDVSTHDWASMVAYASFSDGIENEVLNARYEAASRGGGITNDQIETLVQDHSRKKVSAEACERSLGLLVTDLEESAQRMPTHGDYQIEGPGLLGAKDKRKAQALYLLAEISEQPERRDRYLARSLESLRSSGESYRRAATARMEVNGGWKVAAPHWVLTQALCVEAALRRPLTFDRWSHARSAAEVDLISAPEDRAWSHASLLELYLLSAFVEPSDHSVPWERAEPKARECAQEVGKAVELNPFIVQSTLRQIRRYSNWWTNQLWIQTLQKVGRNPNEAAWERAKVLAQRLDEILADALPHETSALGG